MNLSLFKPLNETDLKNEFVLHVEELIISERIFPGDRLPSERELAEHYAVSRPLIHEGFLILESKGLVTMRPRHGVVVNNYRKQAGLEVLLSLLEGSGHEPGENIHTDLEHFRAHMEKDMVSLICRRLQDNEINLITLEEINIRMGESQKPEHLAEIDFLFHLEIAFLSGNALYPLLVNTLKPAHTRYLTRFYKSLEIRDKAVEYHRMLLDSLADGDEKAAGELIVILDSYSSYL